VVHVISRLDPRHGGPAVALMGLATSQRRAGAEVAAAIGVRREDEPNMRMELAAEGVDVRCTGVCSPPLFSAPDMRQVVESAVQQADVIHIHGIWLQIHYEAARAARRFGKPYIFRTCGMLDPWCLQQSKLKKQLYMMLRLNRYLNGAAAIHFTSETERVLVEPLGLKAPSIVEPNGVDLREFDNLPVPGAFRSAFPAVGDRPIVLFLSRVHKKKGLDLLIPAFARARRGNAMLVIAGHDDRNYLVEAQKMVKELGLEEDVIFTGLLKGRARIEAMVDAEFFALPSYQENFGIAVVEALAAGTPVLISDQVNIHGEVSAAEVGVVVPLDQAKIAQAIEDLLASPSSVAAMRTRSRPFVQEHFDWDRIALRWMRHYDALTGRASRAIAG